jgi:hypothetical protein
MIEDEEAGLSAEQYFAKSWLDKDPATALAPRTVGAAAGAVSPECVLVPHGRVAET